MNFDLFVDTSRKGISMALLQTGEADPRYLETVDESARGETASALLDALLEKAGTSLDDITRVMVTLGPGSFSGLRTGVAFCEGLCFSGKRKLYGVSTLQALACFAPIPENAGVIVRARKDFWYMRESGKAPTELFIETDEVLRRLQNQKIDTLVIDDAVIGDEALSAYIASSGIETINEKGQPLSRWQILFDKVSPSLTQEANYIQPSYFEKLH